MKNTQLGKRIGFTLASIHAGSGVKLWTAYANHAQRHDGAFFIFPGGKIEARENSEKKRNAIYSLVNSANLDGLISWSSSLGSTISLEKLNEFHKKFDDLPFVTIGQKIENHPVVEFDAYTGMKQLVEHFIHHHGAKRIVFLRAPENHSSANDRYRAFVDAITEAGLFTDENKKLISDPFDWNDGLGAMRQICDERNLRPGKDFDAVIAASDLMAFAAVNWLGLFGCRVPDDILVGGFNNSVESQISSVPFSTVHMPFDELGLEAERMLERLLNGEKKIEDKLLAAYPVIRESCGCNTIEELIDDKNQQPIETEEQLLQEVKLVFKRGGISEKRLEKMVAALFDEEHPTLFYNLALETLTRYFEKGGEISKIFITLKLLRHTVCLSREHIESILKISNIIIPKLQAQIFSLSKYESGHETNAVNTLKSELLSVCDRAKLIAILEKYLPLIGIQTSAIILYENEEYSQYAGGFDSSGELMNETSLFPSNLLVPVKFNRIFESGVFIVQPLFTEEKDIGYIILGFSSCDPTLYEDLRHSISSALQSIFQFEEMTAAKQQAEQAERAKTEFFSTVGNDLCDPLKDLSAKVTQMEKNITNGVLDADILTEQLLFLKSQITSQLEKMETLIELTRSQLNEIPTEKKLYDLNALLPADGVDAENDLPLLFGDKEKVKKALQILFDNSLGKISVTTKLDGIHIIIDSLSNDWQKPEMLLAEKIILLQYGEIIKAEHSTAIILPLPNLSGTVLQKTEEEPDKIYALSRSKPAQLFSLPTVLATDDTFASDSEKALFLYWDTEATAEEEWIKIYGLRHNEQVFKAPVVCYDKTLVGTTFLELLEKRISNRTSSTVLFVNAKHTRYGTWATDENVVTITSMTEFDKIVNEVCPSLIVFEEINESSIKHVRKNPKTVLVPILVLPNEISTEEEVDLLCSHPRIILCNRGAAESEQFNARIQGVLSGDEILPPHTGALVKKAILYLNKNASQQIVRWKLADTVHVSEDYLTRIFHKELGLSLWEYLNRYRIYLATKMLLETNDTIYEIAENTGFQDQAYFCRVFKKIYGVPPGKIRARQ
ncbi:MAG: substrate-binding domain-containing protein [Treponema sp.]|nr:substrate-binding domain-containing protein [Treponema sp.]